MAEFSRSYFLPLAIVAGTAVSAYDWALYNFDRICDGEGMSAIVADSPFNVTVFDHLTQNSRNEEISVSSTNFVRVCNEERCCQEVNFSWPPIPSRFESNDFKFMTQNQRFITSITGWLSVVVVVGFFLAAFGHTLWLGFKKLFFIGTIDVRFCVYIYPCFSVLRFLLILFNKMTITFSFYSDNGMGKGPTYRHELFRPF